jgi:hypothetical protein
VISSEKKYDIFHSRAQELTTIRFGFIFVLEEFENFQCYLNGEISQVCSNESKT